MGKTREVSVVRQNIVSPAVESEIDGEIGILKVNRFGDDTVSLSRKYASEFVEKGVKKVILDLRNNRAERLELLKAIGYLARQSNSYDRASRF